MATGAPVEVVPKSYSYVFSPYREPVAHVRPGDRVAIYTNDAFEGRITHAEALPSKALQGAKFLNPQTGPIYVEGVEPGDTLVVQIESIEPTRDFAVSWGNLAIISRIGIGSWVFVTHEISSKTSPVA